MRRETLEWNDVVWYIMLAMILWAAIGFWQVAFCAETNDIDVKVSWDRAVSDETLQALQPVPNVPAELRAPIAVPKLPTEAPKVDLKAEPVKKLGFWAKWHPDNIQTYHPKVCKKFKVINFFYEHGGKQGLDIAAKGCQIATPFVLH